MKKLLMIVCLSLFVVSGAYALDFEIFGAYELEGDYIMNDSVGKGDTARDSSYYQMDLVIWGRFLIDPKTAVTVRTYPFYSYRLGTAMTDSEGAALADSGAGIFDRAYITYRPIEKLVLDLGRMTGNNYDDGFGGGWYTTGFGESGGRNQLRATYAINDKVEVFAVTEKAFESSIYQAMDDNRSIGNGQDWDSYLVGAKIASGNLSVNPTLAFSNFPGAAFYTYSGYVSFAYAPEQGFNLKGAGAYISASEDDDTYGLFGAYLDASLVKDTFTVGVLGAYASSDNVDIGGAEVTRSFHFGGEFDRNFILDDHMNYNGMPAMTMFQLYGNISPMERLIVSLSGAYYMSNVQSDGEAYMYVGSTDFPALGVDETDKAILKDTSAYEIDLIAAYELTEHTVFSVGAGYAQFQDLGRMTDTGMEKYSPDGITMLYWSIATEF